MKVLWEIWAETGIDNDSDESKDQRKEYIKEQLKSNRFLYLDIDDVVRASPLLIAVSLSNYMPSP